MEFAKGFSPRQHLDSLEREAERLLPLRPVLLNVHSGEDTWTLDEMHEYFDGAAGIAAGLGVPLAHETHRGRCLFHPVTAREILTSHPELLLVADFSHWVCACERLIEDQEELIALAAARTVHLHARIGFDQGPQVPDPRDPAWEANRKCFGRWWRMVAESMAGRGFSALSFCPEYGPPPY